MGISSIPAFLFLLAVGVAALFSRRFPLIQANLHGIILFLLFLPGYFLISSVLNTPEINTNNIYFAGDSGSWYQRMAGEEGWNTGTRGVHPLAHLIFRPLVSMLTMITSGNRFYANLLLLAMAGSGCVFLMWKIVYAITENDAYSILSASLLGLSASHLIFANVIETYIFSTFCLLYFVWLLFKNKSTYLLVAASIATFGITITNLAQQVLTFWFIRKDLRQLVKIFGLVIVLSMGLNFISKVFYPITEYFFIPQNLTEEQRFSQEISANRVKLVVENLFIYNIAAPQPYMSIRNDMPRFNFLHETIQNYIWFGWAALLAWIVILTAAVMFAIFKRTYKPQHLQLVFSMLACIGFNLILHIGYGVEPFLYTPNWTYALVLAVTILLQNAAKRTWFTPIWLLCITAIAMNNFWFIYLIARQVSEFIS